MRPILSGAGIVLALGIFFFYTKPSYDTALETKASIAEYDQALEKAAELQQLKQALLSRYNTFDPANIDRLHKLLPDHVDNVRLVLDLDNLALKRGLALENVVISSPGQDEGGAPIIGGISSRGAYDSLTLRFATNGTYSNFVSFIQDIEASLRIVDLVALTLESTGLFVPGVPGTSAEPVYRFDLTLRTYWLK